MLHTDTGISNNGSVEAYIETLSVFAKNAKKYVQEIENFYDSDDIKNATVKIHALKSTARIIGATELGELAQELEDAGNAEDRAVLEEKLPGLLDRSRKLGDALLSLTEESKGKNTGKPEITDEELKDIYSKIKGYAEDCDDAGIEETMEKLAEYALPDAEREKVNTINAALEEFDFDGIVEIL